VAVTGALDAIRLPSGDHAGSSLGPLRVSCRGSPPSRSISQISVFPVPLRFVLYAIVSPSGDTAGVESLRDPE
jgi:hypothetical protein